VTASRVIAPFGRRVVEVTRREEYGPYVVLSAADPEGPVPAAGQFYMLSAQARWGGGEDERPFLPRAFSVLRARRAGAGQSGARLQFMLEDVGPGTARLCELRAGEALGVLGPLGQGFRAPREGRRAVLVGGGVGIAPLAIWRDALGCDAVTLLGFRDGAHAAGARLLPGAVLATDDGSHGHCGMVTDLLGSALKGDAHVEVYACGPPAMLEAARAICAERAIPAQLALESGMACGFGACFGCAVPTRRGLIRLCVDGPVLEAADLQRIGGHEVQPAGARS
jgi:dihydroorotate dehydrogenase electron transfer subunit